MSTEETDSSKKNKSSSTPNVIRRCCTVPKPCSERHHIKQVVKFAVFLLIITFNFLYYFKSLNEPNKAFRPPAYENVNNSLGLKNMGRRDDYVPIFGNKSLTLHCGQCALVTSSSHVLGTGAGAEIDRTECVIRMNDAPTSGFEADVGNKTSLRVVAHSSVKNVIRKPQEFFNCQQCPVIIFWGPPTKIGQDAKGGLNKWIHYVAQTYTNLTTFVVTPSKMLKFDKLFHKETGRDRLKSHSWLSTGWFTMVISIEICDKIKVYGMVPPDYCGRYPRPKTLPYHYYNPRGSDECVTYVNNEKSQRGSHHRFITEKQVFARWAKLYDIDFVYPTW